MAQQNDSASENTLNDSQNPTKKWQPNAGKNTVFQMNRRAGETEHGCSTCDNTVFIPGVRNGDLNIYCDTCVETLKKEKIKSIYVKDTKTALCLFFESDIFEKWVEDAHEWNQKNGKPGIMETVKAQIIKDTLIKEYRFKSMEHIPGMYLKQDGTVFISYVSHPDICRRYRDIAV